MCLHCIDTRSYLMSNNCKYYVSQHFKNNPMTNRFGICYSSGFFLLKHVGDNACKSMIILYAINANSV